MRLVVDANVRRIAKSKDKKISKSFLNWLNRKVESVVNDSIHAIGSRVILNEKDAEAYDVAKNMLLRKNRRI